MTFNKPNTASILFVSGSLFFTIASANAFPTGPSESQVSNASLMSLNNRVNESREWLSGTTALEDWYEDKLPQLSAPFPPHSKPGSRDPLTLGAAIKPAFSGPEAPDISARLSDIVSLLLSGKAQTPRESRSRVYALGPWALPPTNQIMAQPTVLCAWGAQSLRVGLLGRMIGHLNFVFPPTSTAFSSVSYPKVNRSIIIPADFSNSGKHWSRFNRAIA